MKEMDFIQFQLEEFNKAELVAGEGGDLGGRTHPAQPRRRHQTHPGHGL